jgi:NADH-quinone oxidoreductase subunit B
MRVRLPGEPVIRVDLHHLGLACCALEVEAAMREGLIAEDVPPDGTMEADVQQVDGHVLLVAGTVTHALAPAVRAAWEAMPEPRFVLSFGACADSGGPYWDAPTVRPGIDGAIPVGAYVPGCPPRPDSLASAIRLLLASPSAGMPA